jgi:signal transduction histidine kinase
MVVAIVRNLVTNAIKFSYIGGKITIGAKPGTGNLVEISIRDSGIGMSKKMVENLFRLDEQTNRKGTEGEPTTGLGLIICKEFVEKHGGKLWVDSEEGEGSTVYFSLPAGEGKNDE